MRKITATHVFKVKIGKTTEMLSLNEVNYLHQKLHEMLEMNEKTKLITDEDELCNPSEFSTKLKNRIINYISLCNADVISHFNWKWQNENRPEWIWNDVLEKITIKQLSTIDKSWFLKVRYVGKTVVTELEKYFQKHEINW